MQGPDAIAELFSQVRGYTLRFLEQTPDEGLLWTPPGLTNHILWRSGHAAWAIDYVAIRLITGESGLPADWSRRFGERGTPPNQTTDWPTRPELLTVLVEQRERLLALLADLDPAALLEPAEETPNARTLGSRIIHAIHDEALHQGESYLTLKLLRAGAAAAGSTHT